MYQRVLTNLQSSLKRNETLEGRRYLVVPMVMLTPGVHNGSEGPLLYLPEELSKKPESWNHKPVVVYHPTLNGEGVSACDPKVIETRKIGLVFNSNYDNRLKSEAWLDEDKTRRVDNRVLEAINANQMMEVSTGLFQTPEVAQGFFDGKSYTGIVRNILPDHLAILPDAVGACSIADGAGLLRNNGVDLSFDDVREQARSLLRSLPDNDSYSYICDVFAKYIVYESLDSCFKQGYRVKDGKVALVGTPEKVRKQTQYVTANGVNVTQNDQTQPAQPLTPDPQLSDIMIRQQAGQALSLLYSSSPDGSQWDSVIDTVNAGYVQYHLNNKHYRLAFVQEGNKIHFTGNPEEITSPPLPALNGANVSNTTPTKNTVYQGADALASAQSDGQDRNPAPSERKGQVDTLIAGNQFSEGDRAGLMGLSDGGFKKLMSAYLTGANQPIVPYKPTEQFPDRSSVANNQQALSTEAYIMNAPPEVREILQDAITAQKVEKDQLVAAIVTNSRNVFTKEYLQTLPTQQLKGMAALAGTNQRVSMNQSDIPMFIDNNQNQQSEQVPLSIPRFNFKN